MKKLAFLLLLLSPLFLFAQFNQEDVLGEWEIYLKFSKENGISKIHMNYAMQKNLPKGAKITEDFKFFEKEYEGIMYDGGESIFSGQRASKALI